MESRVVWACESGEHMPDKKAYVDEMMRRASTHKCQAVRLAAAAVQAPGLGHWPHLVMPCCPAQMCLAPHLTPRIATWCQREETPETPFRCALRLACYASAGTAD